MKFGHTFEDAMRLFSEQSALVLPWLNYKVAKKELSKAEIRLQQQMDHDEAGNLRNIKEVVAFFAVLRTSLAEVDAAFREHAAGILQRKHLAKALSLLQPHGRWRAPGSTSVWWHEAKVRFTCHGLSLQTATLLTNSAFQVVTWAELNAVAMHKILKKFDKRLAKFCGTCINFRQEQYQLRAFLQGPMVSELRCCCRLGKALVRQHWLSPVAMPNLLEKVPTSCPVCFSLFVEPLGLPCGHCLCRCCHTGLTIKAPKLAATCPLCRAPCGTVPVPMRHLAELAQNVRHNEQTSEMKAEEAARRLERQFKSLPPSAKLVCATMEIFQ